MTQVETARARSILEKRPLIETKKKPTIEAKETYDGLATGGDSGSLKELALAGLEAVSDCFSPSSFRYDKKLAPTSALAKKIKKNKK